MIIAQLFSITMLIHFIDPLKCITLEIIVIYFTPDIFERLHTTTGSLNTPKKCLTIYTRRSK